MKIHAVSASIGIEDQEEQDIQDSHLNGDSHLKDDDFSDDEPLQIKGHLSPPDTMTSTPDMKRTQQGSYINGDIFDGSKEDTDSSEEMDMAPRHHQTHPHQITKYTSREDVVRDSVLP